MSDDCYKTYYIHSQEILILALNSINNTRNSPF